MNNISDDVDASVKETLEKLGVTLCADGKEFLSIEDKNWKVLLEFYSRDFQFNCRYPIINGKFALQCNDKDLLHQFGFYIDETINETDSDEVTLLGNTIANLTLSYQTRIAIKDSAELTLVPNSNITIFLFDNAKVTILDGTGEVIVRRYSDDALISSEFKEYKEYNYAKRNN